MLIKPLIKRLATVGLLGMSLSGCFHPPYNQFQPDHRVLRTVAITGGIGAGAGALIGSAAGATGVGALIGGVAGIGFGLYQTNMHAVIKQLQAENIQYIVYGNTMTLIVPTDQYFFSNSADLNEFSYAGLNNIVRLLSNFPHSVIFVAGFTDNIGSRYHKKMMSEAQAQTILTFLWANHIPAQLLHAKGYSDKYAIGDNRWIHASAYNRRIEIQWQDTTCNPPSRNG